MSRFSERAVIVTGGTGGIGKAIVHAFLDEGARVMVLGSSEPRLQALREELDAKSLNVLKLDLRDGADRIQQVALTAVDELGSVDVLVNCAGVAFQTPLLEITEDQWDVTLSVNLKGAFFLSQACARTMVGSGGGVIVNVCSADSFRGSEALYADYCASKAALAHLTSVMALELGALGVRCNAVAPGPVATPMMDFAGDEATFRYYTQLVAQRRFSTPEEQAKAVLFLASDDASNITGETLRVDGGWMLGMWPDPALEP
jgi:3-oxoacyl-[acyl-carrier protein] reductase